MQNVFNKLLDNLIVAALVPSLAFFSTLVLLFENIIPKGIVKELHLIFETRAVLIVVLAICLSFILSYFSETIYLIYRGEKFPKDLNFLEIDRANKMKEEIKSYTKIKKEFLDKGDLKNPKLKETIIEEKRLINLYNTSFPPDKDILPTRFGNILKAAEYYPYIQYAIEAPQIWSRLKLVVPAESMEKIDRANHEMAFLINSSLLLIILAIISFSSAIFEFLILMIGVVKLLLSFFYSVPSHELSAVLGFGILYLVCGYAFTYLSYGFYRLSIPITLRYAELYRCAFDLFRFKVIEELRFERPKSTEDESAIWQYVTAYLTPDLNFIERKSDEMEKKDFVHPSIDKITHTGRSSNSES